MAEAILTLGKEIRDRPDWVQILRARRSDSTLPTLSGRDLPGLFQAMRDNFLRGRSANALAISRVAAFLDPALFIREARRHGLFRSSKVGFRGEPITYLVSTLIEDCSILSWSSDDIDYLISVRNLLSLAPGARATRLHLVAELYRKRKTVVKSCMVCMDRAFRPAIDQQPDDAQRIAEATGDPGHFHREQHASSFSTILILMREAHGIDESALTLIDAAGIRDGTYERLMMDAERLNEFKEAEVQLDCFPYRAEKIEGNAKAVMLSAIDTRLEQAIRLGFIQASMQAHIVAHFQDTEGEHIASLQQIATTLYSKVGHLLIDRVREPVDRYVMALPMHPDIVGFLSDSKAFREEAFYLRHISREAFAEDSIGEYLLVDGISVMDMLKVKRFFFFMATLFFQALDAPAFGGDRDELDMHSRIPVYREEQLLGYLGGIYGEPLAKRALEVLSYDAMHDTRYYDIQYRPILRIGSRYMIPLSVLNSSDLVRNVLYEHSARLLPKDGKDPMLGALASAFAKLGFCVAAEVRSGKSKIDLVAYYDGHLFIFEGKNAFHPCSAQEMRTSYTHILHAGDQLTRDGKWIASPQNQTRTFKNLGWQAPPAEHLHTCIVTANRVFNGYAIDGHPVRQAHELLNVLEGGIANIGEARYRFWRGGAFSVDDLVDYLNGTSIVRDYFEAMSAAHPTVRFKDGRMLVIKTFGLDTAALVQKVDERYERIADLSMVASIGSMSEPPQG